VPTILTTVPGLAVFPSIKSQPATIARLLSVMPGVPVVARI
jgi:hypothetical protein